MSWPESDANQPNAEVTWTEGGDVTEPSPTPEDVLPVALALANGILPAVADAGDCTTSISPPTVPTPRARTEGEAVTDPEIPDAAIDAYDDAETAASESRLLGYWPRRRFAVRAGLAAALPHLLADVEARVRTQVAQDIAAALMAAHDELTKVAERLEAKGREPGGKAPLGTAAGVRLACFRLVELADESARRHSGMTP